ncbi:MAG: Gfo/Idh/MocA family oxidoreductase, partial [Planctomycetes bacterium]|nr:Gfo/Idh/MocA family oxidoreductase [Planctomycetota bacterium]
SAYVKWFRAQDYYSSSDWKGTWALDGGGALMNQGIHSLDYLIYLMGDPVEVSAYMNTPVKKGVEVETNSVALLKFASGALGTIEASTEIYPGYKKNIEICGSEGSISLVENELVHWDFKKKKAKDANIRKRFSEQTTLGGGASDPLAISFEGHRRQFQEVVDVINKKIKKQSCDGLEGLRSVKIVNAIYKSAQTNKTVKITG